MDLELNKLDASVIQPDEKTGLVSIDSFFAIVAEQIGVGTEDSLLDAFSEAFRDNEFKEAFLTAYGEKIWKGREFNELQKKKFIPYFLNFLKNYHSARIEGKSVTLGMLKQSLVLKEKAEENSAG